MSLDRQIDEIYIFFNYENYDINTLLFAIQI